MSHTQVPEIELSEDGKLSLTVEVFGFDAGMPVEISGSATQDNGAIATFHHIQNLPPADPGRGSLLTVLAAPPMTDPPTKFMPEDVITVVGRAAKIWGTVLDEDPDEGRPGVWKARPEANGEAGEQ